MGLRDLVFKIIGQDLSGPAFDSFRKKLDGVNGAMATAGEKIGRVGRSLQDVGNTGSVVFGAGVSLALRDMIRDSSAFEAALNRLQPVLGLGADGMDEMSRVAIRMGAETRYSALEAADAMNTLARNGLDAAQITGGALAASLDIAAASGAGLSDAADLATDVMLAFGLSAGDMATIADRMSGVLNESKYGFDDYKMALGQAAGVAAGVGVEFDEMNAALAATAHLFAGGSDAGTSFKVFLQRLVPQSSDAAAVIQNLGLQFFDAGGRMRSIAEIAGELQTKMAGLSEEARTDALSNLFGTDAMRTAIGLMQAGAEGVERLDAAIRDADSAELAAARMKGAEGAVERFRASVETLNIAVGASGVLDSFTDMTNGLAGLIGGLSDANPHILEFGATWGALGVALSAAAVIIGGLVAVVGAPVAAVIAGVSAMAAAIWTFRDEIAAVWDWIAEKFALLPDWAETMAAGVVSALARMASPFHQLKALITDTEAAFAWMYDRVVGNSWVPDMVDEVGQHFGRLTELMVKPAEEATAQADGLFSGMADQVAGRLGRLAGEGALTWSSMWGEMLSTGIGYRDRILSDVGNQLASGLSAAIFGGGAGAAGAAGGGLGGIAGSFLKNAFGSVLGALPGFASGGVFSAASGRGGRDRNVAAFRVSKDEEVSVTRRGEGTAPPVVVNIYAQDVASFGRSRAQIGRAIGRAAAAGSRSA